jgi:hypothetical protein
MVEVDETGAHSNGARAVFSNFRDGSFPPLMPTSRLLLPVLWPAGGDYGKKELSPALSNRFTSIWVAAIEDSAELLAILESRLTGACCCVLLR